MLKETCPDYPSCPQGHCVPPCCYPQHGCPKDQCLCSGLTLAERIAQAELENNHE